MRAKPLANLLLGAGLAMLLPLSSQAGDVEKSYWSGGGQYVPDPAGGGSHAARPAAGLMVKMLKVMPDGSSRYVSARRTFTSGDRFKLEVRPNTKGYVYIFNQEEGGEPQLVYPIKSGLKQLKKGQKLLLPGSGSFEFDNKPGKERLTLVLAKAPIEAGTSGQKYLLKPIQTGDKGMAIEDIEQDKGIVIVAPEDRFEGGRAHLVYTLELKHE